MAGADHIGWLHHGSHRATRWGNLGLWSGSSSARGDYAQACTALAHAVGDAAGVRHGDSVLSLACGGGEELALWAEHFGAASVMALELSPSLAAQARQRSEAVHANCAIDVHCADAGRLPQLIGGRFDRIVCVDAIYHLGPREPLLRAARSRLFAGGGFAVTDLVLEDDGAAAAASWRRAALRLGAAFAGIEFSAVRSREAQLALWRDAGFSQVHAMRLDEAVLDGFCAYAQRQARRLGWAARASAGWRRVAATAWLIRTGRAAGLGYALFAGRAEATIGAAKRAAPSSRGLAPLAPATAVSALATTCAERTALSSSGIPGRA
jgi:SAM-dependent methyltransferase